MIRLPPDACRQLEGAAQMMVSKLGEGAAIVLCEGDRACHAFAAHREQRKRRLAGLVAARLLVDRQLPLARVRDGRSGILVEDLTRGELHDERLQRLLRDAGIRSAVAAPVHATLGGVVAAWSSEPARYDAADLGLVAELGHVVERIVAPGSDAGRAADELLAAVRHDLGNPLQSIALNLEVILAHGLEHDWQATRDQLEHVRQATARAQQLLGELDAFLGERDLDVERPAAASATVTEVIAMLGPLARRKQIRLVADLDDGGARVAIPSRSLFRVLSNLAGNAVKYCQAGAIVTLSTTRRAGWIVFGVVDNGPGIAVQSADQLFDAAWLARSGLRKGSGLGLAICKRIVSQYGGELRVSTRAGRGSAFHVELPEPAARP